MTGISRFGAYEGNVKYFCESAAANYDGDVAFLASSDQLTATRDRRVSFYERGTLSAAIRVLRSSVIVVDGNEWAASYLRSLASRSRRVQLWHGSGMKSIGLLRPEVVNAPAWRRRWLSETTSYDLLLLTSNNQLQSRGSAFNYRDVVIDGYPRNDILLRPVDAGEEPFRSNEDLRRLLELRAAGTKIVTYAPTWRKNENDPEKLNSEIAELAELCTARGARLVLKLHPKCKSGIDVDDSLATRLNASDDIYPVLALTDILITDYSSIFVDFLLADRPIVFFPYDEETYIGKERALLLDYSAHTPGPRARTIDDLTAHVATALADGEDPWSDPRRKTRDWFFDSTEPGPAERLISEIGARGW